MSNLNARYFIWSNGLQNLGDQIVASKTVLPALFNAAGVPVFFTGLLTPIRESGSMLPQAALTPWVTTHRARKRLWMIGSIGQAISAAVIALAAFLIRGTWLGVIVLLAVVALSLFRALCSIAGKDVQARTISKGQRGRVTGSAAALGGGATLLVGVILFLLGDLTIVTMGIVLFVGAFTWAFAAWVFSHVKEPLPEGEHEGIDKSWWTDTWQLFTSDTQFRDFVIVRALLLVSALSTAFIVLLHDNLSGVFGFVLASGLASLVGGRISGVLSDKSSKNTMAVGAAASSVIILLIVASSHWASEVVNAWVMPLGFFAVNLAHTAVRVARKTYVVDMAGGDKRTQYVGAANTMMGIILLILGGISSVIAIAGPEAALIFLALVGFLGVWRAGRLTEVSRT
ncbi:MFS transporter [Corynebacterium macginleyi]|uniref:MFS transporter n=1 Tax=Corynebacterium macginleyi TaxID=38290 RepID=A0ABS1Y9C9_9CORY|nr:MFS transporter [Corynebacterium macginleyi]MBK4142332.1 MFS transporter [Corynebacterium macginleyi]MBK4144783.1 MFS transporter [Corynebacterium macginleyi]MBK4151027.1 MFS transporter [Corynebacterium macginleyi]MBK4152851.1 MFS transporter [Corynebacterium macginleyi]MBK4166354.1 MFS transporter [Corynebacterium macginleyi]